MSDGRCPFTSRRGFLRGTGGALAGFGLAAGAATPVSAATPAEATAKGISPAGQGPARTLGVPFHGSNQAGILTATQNHTYFAAFDLVANARSEVEDLLRRWTEAASRMAEGRPVGNVEQTPLNEPAPDTAEALGLGAARLTLTFGFGSGLFIKDGKDRYGLAAHRPDALVDMPVFNGDQMQPERTGGDLSVQACADDPQVAFHAIRQFARLADGVARLRWTQTGFTSNFAAEDTPRNLMGFKDGTQNPIAVRPVEKSGGVTRPNPQSPDDVVWVGADGPAWMRGGSYVVVRRIRMALEHWDNTDVEFQELTIGRKKYSGAPLGQHDEFDPLDLDAVDEDGNPVIPDNAHVRLATASTNDGAEMLRRGYSYNDGVNFTAERWPPWRQGLEYDAGLLFICYQRDPRKAFIQVFEKMAKLDALNQYTTHTGGGLFACPGGIEPGRFIGQALFETA